MKRIRQKLKCLLPVMTLSAFGVANAQTNGPLSTIFGENLRSSMDFSTRTVHFDPAGETGQMSAIGIDFHKVISSDHKDIGTLLLQGYFTRLDNFVAHPGFFKNEDDSEFVYRIFNFNYTALPGAWPNVKFGHFEIPFGLEHTINTNGTLRQFNQPKSIGVKADWGVTLNNQHRNFEYEASLSTGGGQSLGRKNDSFVSAVRVGSRRDEDFVIGGAVYRSRLGGVLRSRVGVDVQYYLGRHGFLTDFSVGENGDVDVTNSVLEWNFNNRRGNRMVYAQYFLNQEEIAGLTDRSAMVNLGVRADVTRGWSVSVQVGREVDSFNANPKKTQIALQMRFRTL